VPLPPPRRDWAFTLRSAPTLIAAGRRVAAADRRLGFGALVASLRAPGAPALPRVLAEPARLAAAVDRLLFLLPPREYGRCLRRSLLLLDLWSRCGLAPRLYVAFRTDHPDRRGHAWVTAEGADGARFAASGPLDDAPVFEL
jgi:hypothetical protein